MATALQLVNRVQRLSRLPDTPSWPSTGPATPDALVFLDLVNEAWREVLEGSEHWDFDVQTNGVLQTQPLTTGTTGATVVNGSTNAIIAPYPTTAPMSGSYLTRFVVTNDASFSGTAFNVLNTTFTPSLGNLLQLTLDEPWPGTTALGAPWNIFVNEYILPTNVRAVLSLRHQQTPIQLRMIEKQLRYDGIMPRPWQFTSSFPWIGIIGNLLTGTSTAPAASPQGLGLVIFPTPSASYRVDYDYLVRRTPLVMPSDVLANVPDSVVDVIVNLAFGNACYTEVVNDPALGSAVLTRTYSRLKRLRDSIRPAQFRHTPVKSLDDANVGIRRDWGRLPPITGSII